MKIDEKEGELAMSLHNKIAFNERERRKLLFENARLVNQMKETGLYKVILGDQDAQWTGYLTQFEVFYSRSKLDALDRIYTKFIKEIGITHESIADIPFSKLTALIPIVTRENIEEWLVKARELTTQDFNDEVRVAKGGESYLNCSHEKETIFTVCDKCGMRHKQNEHETKRA